MDNFENFQQRIARLTSGQISLLDTIVDTFEQPITSSCHEQSDIASNDFLTAFGDMLKLHHTLSNDYLDKHRFEAVLERVFRILGHKVERPSMNNPGHDISVNDEKWSLKTQGNKNIRKEKLHISKFMELGKGQWKEESDLKGLRKMFLHHMEEYSRIFQLRYFALGDSSASQEKHFYELVEIPKTLLQESTQGHLEMRHNSTQTPKPGYCMVTDKSGNIKFQLYFDGGTERKLQIKNLQKHLCMVHATWKF